MLDKAWGGRAVTQNTTGTAVYGTVRTVVWEGGGRDASVTRRALPDLDLLSLQDAPATFSNPPSSQLL